MDGMTILEADGLDLARMAASTQAELLAWHNVAAGDMPDADTTVLMWALREDGEQIWEGGWWDGEHWRQCGSGCVLHASVTHWADPNGPTGAAPCSPMLDDMQRLQNDLALSEFASDTAQARLSGLVAQLKGEQGVMAGLMRELLAVVETIEPEDTDESLHLWALKDKASTLLLALDAG